MHNAFALPCRAVLRRVDHTVVLALEFPSVRVVARGAPHEMGCRTDFRDALVCNLIRTQNDFDSRT